MVQSVDMGNLMAASGGVDGVIIGSGQPQSDINNPSTSGENQFSKQHYSVWGDDEE